MNGHALAGDFMHATPSLEAIARHFVGEDVRVRWQPSQHWLGLARRTPDGAEILLNPGAAAADLGHIFFHEMGHHVRGHVTTVVTSTPAQMAATDSDAILARLTPPEQAAWGATIDAREAQADAWAQEYLEAFQARFGPFLGALR